MVDLPRSAVLAAWGSAYLDGRARLDDVVRAVTRGDEPHSVDPTSDVPTDAADLADLLRDARSGGVRALRLALPAPGDPVGLPGPPGFNEAALEAGECVLAEAHPPRDGGAAACSWGLVPQVTAFGSAWEQGHFVVWQARPVLPRPVPGMGGLREAERELREAMREATEALARLDVARWREDAADRVAAVRDGGLPAGSLPAGTPARCVQVLATAGRVRAIVALASEDDGASVTGWQARSRTDALRGLDVVSRRAVVAAVNGALDPIP